MLKLKNNLPQYILCAFLLGLCILMLMPFGWMLATSLRSPGESFDMPPSFFPTSFKIENYFEVFERVPFVTFIQNSFIVAILAVSLSFVSTTLAAYTFSRMEFKGRNTLFVIFLSGVMIPAQATMIPVFLFINALGLVGSYYSLVLPAIIAPFAIFLQRQFMMTIPKSYDEAAFIDGAGRFRIYLTIILPMSKPVLIITTLQAFLGSWNNFMGPLIYLSDLDQMTIPVGIRILNGMRSDGSISVILAGVIMSLLVPTVIYLIFSKQLLRGVSLSGLKS